MTHQQASDVLTALVKLVAKHDRPHGFDDAAWYKPELDEAKQILDNVRADRR